VRALRPFQDPDVTLLAAVGRGEFILNGFRNKDLQALFFAPTTDSRAEKRRRSAWVSRQVRHLRARGIIKKATHENGYQVTNSGRQRITAILAAGKATVNQLSKVA
jgi:hypothetical protein